MLHACDDITTAEQQLFIQPHNATKIMATVCWRKPPKQPSTADIGAGLEGPKTEHCFNAAS